MSATLDSILKKVLAQGGKEQSSTYPPNIFDEHINTATNFLLDRVAEIFPDNQSIVDVARPFLKIIPIPVTGGKINFPDDYRNLLGIAINVSPDFKSLCGESGGSKYKDDPLAKSQAQLDRKIEQSKCISRSVQVVDIDEWDDRTTSNYKSPTYKRPIACIFEDKSIKLCPYDIGSVEMRYLRIPKVYRYGYKENPDHTFVFDPATTEESEWSDNAIQYLVKAVGSLFSIYLRDPEMRDWNMELKKMGLF